MTARALVIGILLGLGVSAFTFFNDIIIRQTFLVSHHLPVAVFGTVVVLLLIANPLLRLGRAGWALRPAEIAVVAAIGLAACAWPSFSFFRGFVANTALPAHWEKTQPAWQATQVMAYVPKGSPEIAPGQLFNPTGLAQKLVAGAEADSVAGRVWADLTRTDREALQRIAVAPAASPDHATWVQSILQRIIRGRRLTPTEAIPDADGNATPWANRRALAEAFPEHILPAPRGGHLLVSGDADEVLAPLITGAQRDAGFIGNVPWLAWWPTLRLWGAIALCLAAASLCLSLIVHPQWSHRELLPYPIPRFLAEISGRGEIDGDNGASRVPRLLRERAFWYALGAVVLLHTLNGLHAWFPAAPQVPLQLNFMGLGDLFPNALRVFGAKGMFRPQLYLSVIAFSFFLSSSVSLSLGLSQLAYMILGVSLITAGSSLQADYIGAETGNMLRFGGYLGMTVMLAYIGRRYYRDVAAKAIGLRASSVPGYAVWAARGLVVATILGIASLYAAGLSVILATLFVLMALMMFVVMSRIVSETGLFFINPWWMPVGVLTALLGVEAIGPTSYIVLALASVVLVGDPRNALMPYLVTGLKMTDDADPKATATPGRIAGWLVAAIVGGFVVSAVAALGLQYRYGASGLPIWDRQTLPSLPFDTLAGHVSELSAYGLLHDATAASGWEWVGAVAADPNLVMWLATGLVLVVATSIARLRFAGWPLHPVLFLIWGTNPSSQFAASFLLGWALKAAVMQLFGVAGYRSVLPVVVGVIAGELLAAFGWSVIGAAYFLFTQAQPANYLVFP